MGSSEEPQARVFVLGVGNELMGDDGVGVHVVRRVGAEGGDPRVKLIEAGTAVPDALDLVPPGARVLVIDAAEGGGPPGAVYRLGLDALGGRAGLSLHETTLPQAFAAAALTGAFWSEVVVLGVEPARVQVGTELSPELVRALPTLLAATREEMRRLLATEPRCSDARR